MPTGGRFLLARTASWRRSAAGSTNRGFVEVEPAALQVSPGNEAHLHAFATDSSRPAASGRPRYLHTSPEFAMKKLLAAGETRIFDFARVFRNREAAPLHAPEFTMLEWYRAGEAYERGDGGLRRDPRRGRRGGGRPTASSGAAARPIPSPTPATADGRRAFAALPASTSLATLAGGRPDRDGSGGGGAAGIAHPRRRRRAWSDIFSRILVERVEPQSRARPGDVPLSNIRSPRRRSPGAKPDDPRCRRTLRALCLRRRARQRLRRADRPGRAAPALRGGDGREAARPRRALSARRGFPCRARSDAARRAASPSASTAW